MSNNLLEKIPKFTYKDSPDVIDPNIKEIYLTNNKISEIQYFAIWTFTLEILNFDFNEVSFINEDAFSNLDSLQNLSISHIRRKKKEREGKSKNGL